MTKDEIRATKTVPEILDQNGIEIKRGRCKAICHAGNNYTAKVTDNAYYCFKCDKYMDIFDLTMHFEHCDFKTAYELLGGTEKPSFTATVKAQKTKKERELKAAREYIARQELKCILMWITAYRNIIAEEEPLSDLWCYCYNRLQYQVYLLELHNEKR